MKYNDFMMLPEIEDIGSIEKSRDNGFMFLYGRQMIAQKNNKQEGQEISYYVLHKYMTNNKVIVELQPKYDILENRQ